MHHNIQHCITLLVSDMKCSIHYAQKTVQFWKAAANASIISHGHGALTLNGQDGDMSKSAIRHRVSDPCLDVTCAAVIRLFLKSTNVID